MAKRVEVEARKAQILAEKAEKLEKKAIEETEKALNDAADKLKEAEEKKQAEATIKEAVEEVKAEKAEEAKKAEEASEKAFDEMNSAELEEILTKAKEKKARAEVKLQEHTDRLKEASENIVSLEEKLEAKKKAEEEARIRAEEEAKRLAESKRKADAQAGAVVAGGESVSKHPADEEDDFEICDNGLWIPTSMRPAKCYKWWNYRKHEWTPTRNIHVAQASSDVWDVVFYWVNKGELVRPLNSAEIEKYVPDIYW